MYSIVPDNFDPLSLSDIPEAVLENLIRTFYIKLPEEQFLFEKINISRIVESKIFGTSYPCGAWEDSKPEYF